LLGLLAQRGHQGLNQINRGQPGFGGHVGSLFGGQRCIAVFLAGVLELWALAAYSASSSSSVSPLS